MPAVADPASTATIAGVQASAALVPSGSTPKSVANTSRPAIATTLLSTGTHVNGPKLRLALSTSPSSV